MTSIEEDILRVEKKVDRLYNLLSVPKKQTWVKAYIVQDLTGWDKFFMQKARQNGLVKFRNDNGKFTYLLESIDDRFLIRKTA